MVQLRMHGETLTKIEIPHKAARQRMVPQGGPVTWQTRPNKVKHECVSKSRVFSDGEPPCIGHTNEYEQGLRSRNRLDCFRGCTEARAMESNGADSSPNKFPPHWVLLLINPCPSSNLSSKGATSLYSFIIDIGRLPCKLVTTYR